MCCFVSFCYGITRQLTLSQNRILQLLLLLPMSINTTRKIVICICLNTLVSAMSTHSFVLMFSTSTASIIYLYKITWRRSLFIYTYITCFGARSCNVTCVCSRLIYFLVYWWYINYCHVDWITIQIIRYTWCVWNCAV